LRIARPFFFAVNPPPVVREIVELADEDTFEIRFLQDLTGGAVAVGKPRGKRRE
jgi:hypothetical protein